MSEQYDPELTDGRPQAERLSASVRLRQARVEKGFSEEDVSRRLNISVRYVRAIEDSEFDVLPNLAFARGYIRSYARYVEIPADDLIEQFNRAYGLDDARREVTTVNKVRPQVKLGDPLIRWSMWLFLALLVGATVWWWQAQRAPAMLGEGERSSLGAEGVGAGASGENDLVDGQPRSLSLPAQAAEEDAEPAPAADDEPEPEYLSESEIRRLQQEIDSAAVDEAPEAAVAEEAQAGGSAPVGDESPAAAVGNLLVRFVDDCWLSVTDGNGRVLFADTKRAGQTLELQAKPPVRMRIGRVSAVGELLYDGEIVDLSAVSRNNVARLTLN